MAVQTQNSSSLRGLKDFTSSLPLHDYFQTLNRCSIPRDLHREGMLDRRHMCSPLCGAGIPALGRCQVFWWSHKFHSQPTPKEFGGFSDSLEFTRKQREVVLGSAAPTIPQGTMSGTTKKRQDRVILSIPGFRNGEYFIPFSL